MTRVHSRGSVWSAVLLVVVVVAGLVGIRPLPALAAAGDVGHGGASYAGAVNPPTEDKPQSKLWWNAGSWWADMWTSAANGWHIFQLNRATETWVDTGVINDTRTNTLADTLWDGTHLYIASHVVTISTNEAPLDSVSGDPAKLYRYSYANGKYTLDSGFPTQITNNSSESLTIDEDSTGALWSTWTQVAGSQSAGYTNSVYVNDSTPGGTSWETPFVIPASNPHPSPDDISAVVAYAGAYIGVMWSDQNTGTIWWDFRKDGTNPTAPGSWHSGSALSGPSEADDHLNLKTLQADSQGRVFAAFKTSLNDTSSNPANPQLILLTYTPGSGTFAHTTISTVGDCVSRPQIVLDSQNNQIHVFQTAPPASVSGCSYSGVAGSIYEKTASTTNPTFPTGRGTVVMNDAASGNLNNVTTSKQTVNTTTGLVALASNDVTHQYWFSDQSLGGTPAAPVAAFTATPTSGTAPLTTQFTDTSSGAPTSWAWTFGDGATSTLQSPNHTYTAAGTYTVSLKATNGTGSNTLTKTNLITVTAAPTAPTAAFTATPTSGTAPLTTQFTDTSTGTPTSWSWNFGDGTALGTTQNPSHVYTAAGTYTVALTATNATGSTTKTQTNLITVTAAPVAPTAAFTATPTSGTAPVTTQFSDTSTGTPTSWSWNFGDGTALGTTQNPSHVYTAAGTYSVSLKATNGTGSNTITKTNLITVTAAPTAPTAAFTATPTSGTAPLTTQFTDTSTGTPTSWSWNFGDGSPANTTENPSHVYTAAGTYTVALTATNATGSTTKTQTNLITVTAAPVAPVASFTATPTSGTAPVTTQFTDTSSGTPTSWSWNFGDGTALGTTQNPSHVYTAAGTYSVSLTAANAAGSATSTQTTQITVTAAPVAPTAAFTATPTSGTAPLTTQFTDTSTGTPTSWSWNFGDGSPANTTENPSHVYTAAGTYTVALTATNATGSTTKTQTNLITVTAAPVAPVASFTATPTSGTAPLTTQFTDTSSGTPTSWSWNFGDGTALGTTQNPSHVYTAAGTYSVSLTAANAAGSATSTQTTQITVTAAPTAPVASFTATPTSGTAPLTTQFTDTSSGTPTSWSWNFGDGTALGTTQNPSHVYTAAGTYSVSLTAANAAGSATSTQTTQITVTAAPVAPTAAFTATPTSGTAPLTTQFTDTSTGTPTSWSWNFGDGSPANTTENPSHVYTAAGTYTVALTATNATGSTTKTQTNLITVTAAPVAPVASFTATPTSGTAPLTTQFTDTSSGTPTSWSWNFGDGTALGTTQNPSHVYTAAGTYSVSLTAANAAGSATSTQTTQITVTAAPTAPVASFTATPTSGTAPLTTQFTDTSSGTPTSWSWNFGDGTALGTTQNPSHVYTAAGTYSVALTAANAAGSATSTQTTQITVTATQAGHVTVGASASSVSTTAVTAVALAKPTGVTAGDVLVASFTSDGLPSANAAPAGWTTLTGPLSIASGARVFVYSHIVTTPGTEPTTYTWTLSTAEKWNGGITDYHGVNTTNPYDTTPTTKIDTTYNATTLTLPAITTTTNGDAIIGGIGTDSTGTGLTETPPTNWTETYNSTGGQQAEQASTPQTTAGTTNTPTWTINAARAIAGWEVALKPAP